MKSPKILLLLSLLFLAYQVSAQKLMWMKPKHPIVCYGKEMSGTSHVPPSTEVLKKLLAGRTSQTKTSNFVVTYNGFSAEAQAAFQKAVDIWESILISPVDIHVTANWTTLGTGVLGSATAGTFYANFDGAQQINTWYPVALAEKMAGRDLNPEADIDIFAQFNRANNSWYYGLDGATPSGEYDLVTVVLHELGHGLGVLDSYDVTSNVASLGLAGTGIPVIYDLGIRNGAGQNLFITTQTETPQLLTQLTSNNLFYTSPEVDKLTSNLSAKIYAPSTFSSGSSIAHLDENSFPGGDANSLMTPQIGSGESNFNPGPIVNAMFSDMGWVFTYIKHQSLSNVEDVNGPFNITATITTDEGSVNNPKLIYSIGGEDISVDMTPTANADEYEATIPTTGVATIYNYYISAEDDLERVYTKPGKRTRTTTGVAQAYFRFETGEDLKAPLVTHTAKTFILNTETELSLEAFITDNIGIASAKVEYSINDVAQPDIQFELQSPGADSIYKASIPLADLHLNDLIKYRLVVVDNSINGNEKTEPATDFHSVVVKGFETASVSLYNNNFNTATDDFFGTGFSIGAVSGFADNAIHSEHPYINGDGFPGNERELLYNLSVPIKVASDEARMRFDEVVLVEPGADGSVFGDADFFDYVIVEGSKDRGTTWVSLLDGYDSRVKSVWLSRFNSSSDASQNSTATGTSSLYKQRSIDLLETFSANDEIVIRFRLHIDQLASGWGWAIDNLYIQDPITGLEAANLSELAVHPNPSREQIIVEANVSRNTAHHIQVVDANGRSVISHSITSRDGALHQAIDMRELPQGLYFLKVTDGTTTEIRKVVKID